MRSELIDDLERFVTGGGLREPGELGALVDRLGADPDPVTALLSRPLGSLLVRQCTGRMSDRTATEVEAIVRPRLCKVMEAARAGLPDSELRVRIEVLDRRLSHRLAEEPSR